MSERKYASVDSVLMQYFWLRQTLGTARALSLPDPDRPRQREAHHTKREGQLENLMVEMAEIGCCVKSARLTTDERRVLNEIYRVRHRCCTRCRKVYPEAADEWPRCPVCNADRAHGWTYENMPTAYEIAEELSRLNRKAPAWSARKVRRVRDGALARLRVSMLKRELIG